MKSMRRQGFPDDLMSSYAMQRFCIRFNKIKGPQLPFDIKFNLLSILLDQIGGHHLELDQIAEQGAAAIVKQRTALCFLAIDILIYLLSLIKKEDSNEQDILEITGLTADKFHEYYGIIIQITNQMPILLNMPETKTFIALFNPSGLNSKAAIDMAIKNQELIDLLNQHNANQPPLAPAP